MKNASNEILEIFKSKTDKTVWDRIVDLETIPQFLDYISKTYGSLVAYQDAQGKTKTYNELVLDVKKLISVLKAKGIKVGDNVGVYLPNSYDFVVATLATMAYGAIAVLLPIALNVQVVKALYEKYDLVQLWTNKSSKIESTILFEDAITTNDIGEYGNIQPNQPAAILLTGGSTGTPKGVILSHTALMRGTMNGCLGLANPFNETYLCIIPFTHSFGLVRNILCCLYTGSKLCINTNKMDLFKDLVIYKPTILSVVPSLAELFLSLIKTKGFDIVGGKLSTIICGAANVPPYLVTEYAKYNVNFCPGYGLTEFANLVSGNPRSLEYPNSVGLLFPQQEAKIVNGELWLKGRNMMLGYYKDEVNTSLSITEDGWFKTGDLARFDEQYNLYIVGRIKDEIALANGEKVSPAELESELLQNHLIKDCLVYKENELLVAEVTLRINVVNEKQLNIQQVKELILKDIESINKKRPEYMHIASLKIRDKDFDRSPAMKIIRPRD